jgi:hypothetical protein
VTPVLVLFAIVVTAGAVVAVSAREPRLAVLGTFVVLTGSAYVVEPMPEVVALAARLVGSVLAGYLVWIALRGAPPPTTGWRMGWPGAAAVAIVAFAIGWLAAGTLGETLGSFGAEGPSVGAATALAAGSFVPRAALAAALALTALAVAPVLLGRDVLRLGLGLLLLVAAAGLLRSALSVGADSIVELGLAVLTALTGAAVAVVVARSLEALGDLELPQGGTGHGTRSSHQDDAHPMRHRGAPPTGDPAGPPAP